MSLIDQLRDTSSNDLLDSSSNELLDSTRRSSVSAFIVCGTLTTTSQSVFLRGPSGETTSQDVFLHGVETGSDSQPVFLAGGIKEDDSCFAFLEGASGAYDNQVAFLRGCQDTSNSCPAFLCGQWITSQSAFLCGSDVASSTQTVFLEGSYGADSFCSAFLYGIADTLDNQPAYVEGVKRTNIHALIVESWPHTLVFIQGVDYWSGSISAYLECAGYIVESIPAYVLGGTDNVDSTPAFCSGTGDAVGSTGAFTAGVARSSTSGYLAGTYNQVNYIVLESSDGSISGRYRILAMEYGDGTIQSGAQINKTVGGGIDIHTGKTYKIWEPVIKVRHTEPEDGYGTVGDLETLYEYVGLDTPPTRVITFYDHFQVRREVIFLEDFSKVLRLLNVEGTTAWYYVRLMMLKVPE